MEQGVKVGTLSRVKHRLTGWRGRLVRMRHFRGHGVHSPFVYAIVRQVLMRRTLLGADTSLRDALLRAGVGMRRATELQNLMTHCGYRTFALAACAAEVHRSRHGRYAGDHRPQRSFGQMLFRRQ